MSSSPEDLQRHLIDFVRAFGLHQPDTTACGQPISTSEAHALGVISDREGIRITDLAHELVLEKSTVSRLVRSMSDRGWVRSAGDAADRRARLLRLTASGRRAAARLASARATHFESVLGSIDPRRRDEVLGALAELTRAARFTRKGDSDARGA
jgi:DNA-binding MarR family transcriptional regulator